QYSGAHLRTALYVVLGHQGCGAVKAALQYIMDGTLQKCHLQVLIDNIAPGLTDVAQRPVQEQIHDDVEANVRWSMKQISQTPAWKGASEQGAKLVGAIFQITTGEVRF